MWQGDAPAAGAAKVAGHIGSEKQYRAGPSWLMLPPYCSEMELFQKQGTGETALRVP